MDTSNKGYLELFHQNQIMFYNKLKMQDVSMLVSSQNLNFLH